VIGVSYPNGFGTTLVHDRALTDTPDPQGTVIARAHGLHMQAGQKVDDAWYNTFNLVFQHGRYDTFFFKQCANQLFKQVLCSWHQNSL
jgi:hypothetical protein